MALGGKGEEGGSCNPSGTLLCDNLCPALFVVCDLFLPVSNPSCRLRFLLSLDNLLDLNLHLMFFVLRLPSLQSPWLLQRSVAVCCPPVVPVSPPFQLASFPFLNFTLRFNLHLMFSCSLGNLQFLFCRHASMTVRMFHVIGPISFFETLFSSCVSACSWH